MPAITAERLRGSPSSSNGGGAVSRPHGDYDGGGNNSFTTSGANGEGSRSCFYWRDVVEHKSDVVGFSPSPHAAK
ncbi:MAG: hypothetical protein ACTS6A_02905 [Candidatus Hodgkinia cicadicola]